MVSAEQIAATDSLVTDNVVDRARTVLNVRIPDRLSSWWQEATVYVFGCKDGTATSKPCRSAHTGSPTSSSGRWRS